MNIDKIKKELTEPVYNHIGTLNKEQLTKQNTFQLIRKAVTEFLTK